MFDKLALQGDGRLTIRRDPMLYFLQQLLNGLHSGAIYGLLAFGYVLINGVLHRTNLSHGAMFALGGHVMIVASIFAYQMLWLVWPLALGFGAMVAMVGSLAIAWWIARRVFAPLAEASPNAIVVVTLAIAIVIGEAARISVDTHDIWLPPLFSTPVRFAGNEVFAVTLTYNQIAQCLSATALLIVSTLALSRWKAGRIWRAVSDDPRAAALLGVNANRTLTGSVLAGTAFAAIAGIFAALHYGNISFGTGLVYGLKILIVTAAGSYGSPPLAALGAAGFGVGESLWSGYFPVEWRDAWMLAFLIALLVLRTPSNAQ